MAPRSLGCLVMLLATTATAAPLVIAIPDQPTVAAPVALAGGSKQAGDGVVTPVVAPSGHDAAESESKSKQGLKRRRNLVDLNFLSTPWGWIPYPIQSKWRAEAHHDLHHDLHHPLVSEARFIH
ncbi:hypothetical protein PG988_007874 [Apiospora saccharicola]